MTTPLCSVCGKPYEFSNRTWSDGKGNWSCEHDQANTGTTAADKKERLRRENRERTIDARRQAAHAQAVEREVNPSTIIGPIDAPGKRSSFGQGQVTVPKRVVEGLTEKGSAILPNNISE